jgi:hypothetical protein
MHNGYDRVDFFYGIINNMQIQGNDYFQWTKKEYQINVEK